MGAIRTYKAESSEDLDRYGTVRYGRYASRIVPTADYNGEC
jgi:hypothetical protein